MTKRREIQQEKTQGFSKKWLVAFSIVLVLLMVGLGYILVFSFFKPSETTFSLNAAIIDQLGESDLSLRNPAFVENATNILTNYNFSVTYYNRTLDVNFFKELAKNDFGIIILRAHSALRENNSTVDIFTSEEFSEYKHQEELEKELLVRGEFFWAPGKYYLAISSRFVESLEGRFAKSIVIAMGCWSLKPGLEQMANAFISKGATAYIGWTDLVLVGDTDTETLRLLGKLLNENKTLSEAVAQTRSYTYYTVQGTLTSKIRFYPSSASNLTIAELIAETRNPSTQVTLNGFKGYNNFLIMKALTPEKRRTMPCYI